MKAYKKLLVMFLMGATALNLTSCGGDDEVSAPTLTVQSDKDAAAVGDVVTFTVNASSDASASLKTLKIEEIISGASGGVVLKDTTISGKSLVNYVYKYTVPANATGKKDVKFTVTDNGSRNKTVTKSVTVSGSATPKTYSAKMLGAQDNGSAGSFFSTQDGVVYKVADAKNNQGKIDFVFYFGSTNNATVAAPNDAGAAQFNVFALTTWSTKNATMFKKASASAFDATTSNALQEGYSNASGESSAATNLALGDVVTFKTAGNKYGVFKVSALDAKAAGSITLDVKVQE